MDIYLVGGAVRDLLISRISPDLDFAVPAAGISIARKVASALNAHFVLLDDERDTGRVVAINEDGSRIFLDFAVYRGANLEEDLRARDFTINALAYNMRDGTIFDPLDKADINQLDIHFLSKLNAFLEKEISNPELDILLLAKNMNMSRSAFYRKFMGLTKLSPITYLKKHRINRSIELMMLDKYTHIEISEMTGFGSPSYFSRAFKQEKGMSPRDFLNQFKEEAVAEL